MILRPALRPALRGPSRLPRERRGGKQYDYYVSTTGNDANDGLTAATSKATIQSVKALFDASSGDKRVFVAPGTYKGGPYFVTGTYTSRRKITFYMAGVTIDNQDDAAGNYQNACMNYCDNLTVEVVGAADSLCVMKNTANDILNADSSASAGSEATLIARYVQTQDPDAIGDGFSCHGVSIGYAYNCTFIGNLNKSCIAHIDNSRTYHYNCTIVMQASSGNSYLKVSGTAIGAPQAYFEDCIFKTQDAAGAIPMSVNESGTNYGFARFTRCQFIKDGGTWNTSWANGVNSPIEFIDCYADGFNAEMDGHSVARRCYGDWLFRMGRGSGAGNVTIENCAIRRAGAGPILQWTAYATGAFQGGAGGTIKNNVFMDATTAIQTVTTAGAVTAINGYWSFLNNCFYNNTNNYTTGLTADGVDVIANPLLVTGVGSTETNWYVQAGSPCIASGTSGGNIGPGVA